MNMQKPLPNPFGPDKKVPFPSRMPSTGVTPPVAIPKTTLPQVSPQLPPSLPPIPPVLTPPTKKIVFEENNEEELEEDLTSELEEDLVFDSEKDYEEITDEEDEFLSRIFAATTSPVAQQTLFALAIDPNWQIRNAVAMSIEAPKTVLNFLSNDTESFVRQTVLENLNTSDETYANFAHDEDEDVLIAFIQSERTTLEFLKPLLNTDNEFVAEALLDSPLLSQSMKLKIRTKFSE